MARTRGQGGRQDEAQESHPIVDLVRESAVATTSTQDERPAKKRRVAGRIVVVGDDSNTDQENVHVASDDNDEAIEPPTSAKPQQTAYNDSDSSDSEENWEDVDLERDAGPVSDTKPEALSLTLGAENERRPNAAPRRGRTGLNAAERKLHLELHKLHILCLLHHTALRNHWCNDSHVQNTLLQKTLPNRAAEYLDDDSTQSQFQRNRSFVEGLEMATEAFNRRFTVSARGLAKPAWAASPERISEINVPSDIDLPLSKADFRDCADSMSASRDVGAQLFCAMLRSTGLDVRLVASLQVLPLGGSTTAPVSEPNTTSHTPSKVGKKHPRPESKFPVYWVEAFNTAYQKWVPVDALVTQSINQAGKLEPPASDSQNALVYAVAFDADGSARDVSRRYTRTYNAKTLRARVESTKDGEKWMRRVMRLFRSRESKDRDAIEDSQLATRAAQEPMPRSLQDFNGHPVYALERHLRRNEALHPKRSIGKVASGKAGTTEDVFRRAEVHEVRSADAWFRLGREVVGGAEPLKVGRPRAARTTRYGNEGQEEQPGVPLFAFFQTTAYVPPPVVRGRVPRNAFGNLDIYVPGMIPPGGAHVKHALAAKAARLAGVDCADAVVGFEFKGRQGTAVLGGVVVADEFTEAVVGVIQGIEEDRWRQAAEQKSDAMLALWRRFLVALRIRERVQAYADDDEPDQDSDVVMDDEQDDDAQAAEASEQPDTGLHQFVPPPVQVIRSPHPKPAPQGTAKQPANFTENANGAGGFVQDSKNGGGGFVAEVADDGGFMSESGGGFMPEDGGGSIPEDGGGFMPEEDGSGSIPGQEEAPVSGGGFVVDPELNATAGGVFVPEEHGGDIVSQQSGGVLPDAPLYTEAHENFEAGDGSADELEAAQLAQALEESAKEAAAVQETADTQESGSAKQILESEGQQHEESGSAKQFLASEEQQHDGDDLLDTDDETNAGAESDKGSLLSHDPEDEDADPDWLV